MAADNSRIKGWKILRKQDWRSGVHGSFCEVECTKCQGVLTTLQESIEYLACPSCRFRTFLRLDRGDIDLKGKAVERYKEHAQACTALNVELVGYDLFWYEIDRDHELAEPSPIEHTRTWERALRKSHERLVQSKTTSASAHGSRRVERTTPEHHRAAAHRTEQVREGMQGVCSSTHSVSLPQGTGNHQGRGSANGSTGSSGSGGGTRRACELRDGRSQDECNAREDSDAESRVDSIAEPAGHSEG